MTNDKNTSENAALRPLTLDEQAERLQGKGLQFSSKERVKKYLQNVGYCRLKGYFPFFEDPHHRFFDKGEGRFGPDASFDDVLDLYIFDRKLRLILLEAFERIEVALRSLVNVLQKP